MRMLAATCVAVVLAVAPRPGSAQWGIAAEIGVARFGGSSRDTSGTTVGPYRPTTFELRLDRGFGPARVAVALMYAKPGIAGEQAGVALVQYGLASFWEIAPQLSLRLARFGRSPGRSPARCESAASSAAPSSTRATRRRASSGVRRDASASRWGCGIGCSG